MTATLSPETFSFPYQPPEGGEPQELTFNKLIPENVVVPRIHEIAHLLGGLSAEGNVMILPVMKGAQPMMDEMLPVIQGSHPGVNPDIRPIKLSSYSGTSATDTLNVEQDLPDEKDMGGKTVVIVDEVTDSLRTVWSAAKIARARGAAKVVIVALTDKPDAHRPEYDIDGIVDHSIIGFSVPNRFLLGWGMDVDDEYRWLRDIYIRVDDKQGDDEDKYTMPALPTLEQLLR